MVARVFLFPGPTLRSVSRRSPRVRLPRSALWLYRMHRFLAFDVLHTPPETLWTQTVRECGLGAIGDVAFDAVPIVLVVANALAIDADREQALELFYLGQSLLQFFDALL